VLNFGGALLMAIAFEWLNEGMKLQQPSTIAQVVNALINSIPLEIRSSSS